MSTDHLAPAQQAVRICRVDYANPVHAAALVSLLDAYARDPMGGGQGLSEFAKAHVVTELGKLPQAFSLLAFSGAQGTEPAGLVNCMLGFSTFACRPLVNVHDLVVLPAYRGRRLGAALLQHVELMGREQGACKITLEVLSGNASALRLYARSGFGQYQLDPAAGQAAFMQKWLD